MDNAAILKQGFDAIEKIVPWRAAAKSRTPFKGRGLGAAIWLVNPLPGSLSMKLEEDGTVSVVTAATDHGSGALTAGIPQIIAEI